MSRRLPILVASVCLISASIQGCGGGELNEGIPENVDMTQDYTPAAEVGAFSARDMQKEAAAAAKKPAGQ
jgi:hypothetical protein